MCFKEFELEGGHLDLENIFNLPSLIENEDDDEDEEDHQEEDEEEGDTWDFFEPTNLVKMVKINLTFEFVPFALELLLVIENEGGGVRGGREVSDKGCLGVPGCASHMKGTATDDSP